MPHVELFIGVPDFRKIRRDKTYYVDKTPQLFDLLEEKKKMVILFTRPRRFGKTTFQTMIRSFLDATSDSTDLFEGLAVMENKPFVEKWMNKWPVIYLTLKDVGGLSFKSAFTEILDQIREAFKAHEYLLSDEMDSYERGIFTSSVETRLDEDEAKKAIPTLMKLLHRHYGKEVFLLIDEYDVPLAKANSNGYYEEMLSLIRGMFSKMLKDNEDLEKAVLTGCLRMSKESLFTGVNNFVVYSLTESRYSNAFGFDEAEVSKLLSDTGLRRKEDVFRQWYDGYSIGSSKVYTSWDVLSYADALLSDSNAEPKSYWANSAEYKDVATLIGKAKEEGLISNEFEDLLSGGVIEKPISESLSYRDWESSGNNVWSLLLATGYLTLASPYGEGKVAKLRVPNEEVRRSLADSIDIWFSEKVVSDTRTELFDAIWSGDAEALGQIISRYLRKTISYYDYKEDYYHAFLAGLLSSASYTVQSNREKGEGRPDIIIADDDNNRKAVIEVKRSKTREGLPAALDEAVAQIHRRGYIGADDDCDQILAYGVACYAKRAVATLVEL